jgi:hypothetical protein
VCSSDLKDIAIILRYAYPAPAHKVKAFDIPDRALTIASNSQKRKGCK